MDANSKRSVPAGVMALWLLVEEEIKRGGRPDHRHIAEAFRQGQPVVLSAELQRYIATLLNVTKQKKTKKLSTGERAIRDRKMVARFDELAAQDIGRGGRLYGRRTRVLAVMAAERGLENVERQFEFAKERLKKGYKSKSRKRKFRNT